MLVLSRPCKVQVIHDSPGFWIPSCRFQILGTGFRITCQRNLDSGFLELKSGFQSPGVQIPGAKTSRIPEHLDSLNVFYYIPTLFIMKRFAGLRSSRPRCWVMWLEILSCSTISSIPITICRACFFWSSIMGNMTLVPGDMTSGEMTFGRLDRLLLIYRTCFVVNQGLKSEIYYTFIPLVSSHHRFKNEACYTFIPLVSSHDGLKTRYINTHSLFNKN